jgi:hypothetical protein
VLDMAGDVELGTFPRLAPIEQQRAAVHAGNGAGQGYLLVEIENPRRIDQRWDEHDRRAASAMIAEARAADPRDLGSWRGARAAFGALVCAQAGKRVAAEIGIVLRSPPHQLEEQRKRAWCPFMLQCTIIR